MNKLFFSILFSLVFASLRCGASTPPASGTSGNWEYINTSNTYIPYTQLVTAINNTPIPGFDDRGYAGGMEVYEGKGTQAGDFYWPRGSDQKEKQHFMLVVFDSPDKVTHRQMDEGREPLKITKSKKDLIYGEYTTKGGKYVGLILIRNRILLQFVSYGIDSNDLRKICDGYDTSAFEALIK